MSLKLGILYAARYKHNEYQMGRYKKPDLEKFKETKNPFTNNWTYNVRKVNHKPPYEIIGRTHDGHPIINVLEAPVEEQFKEQEAAARIYTSEEFRKAKAKLTPRALHLFMWMIDTIDSGSDLVIVNVNRYVAESEGIEYNPASNKKPSSGKYNTYKLSWEELVHKGMITTTTQQNVFWINPAFFFKGNRIKKYPNNKNIYYSKSELEQQGDDAFWARQNLGNGKTI